MSFWRAQPRLTLKAARDEYGIAIDRFALAGSALEAEAAGTLSNQSGQMDITARLTRLEVLLPQAPGTLELATTLGRAGDTFSGVAELKGPHTSSAKLDGSVTLAGDADFTFAAAWNELERFVPQLAGRLSAEGTAERRKRRVAGCRHGRRPCRDCGRDRGPLYRKQRQPPICALMR